MKANKGFTLLEVAVVLAIIAILAAVLTPIVTSYIDQARVTRAQNDVKKISQAILLFQRDTGFFPGYQSSAAASISTSNQLADCLVSGPSTSVTPGWACGTGGSVNFLENVLNVNTLSLAVGTSGLGGRTAYRGPYLDGLSGLDPWGTPYVVSSKGFSVYNPQYTFAASAGPNQSFDTAQSQPKTGAFATGGDDITSLIH
jgi:prepilin-type N-terminal cleavage/methylation domain-containing protein